MRAVLVAALVLAACGGGAKPPASTPARVAAKTPTAEATATATPRATPVPRLTGATPCPGVAGSTCSTLTVPLDHSGQAPGTLKLRVGAIGPKDAPVLVLLSGGPGQPALMILERGRRWAKQWRVVTLDQRGTGQGALQCPALQKAMGASDLAPPTQRAVTSCADRLGDRRRYFTTTDTVADLDALRIALGADKLALDGVSYGTYVAERYALAHPQNTDRLVLDSVVPHQGATVFSEVSMQATTRVLGARAASELAAVVRKAHDGPQMLDLFTTLSIGTPRLQGGIHALDQAAKGNPKPLDRLAAIVHRIVVGRFPASELSQGLHASTLCADTPAPWGDARAPIAGRQAKLDTAAARLTQRQLGPYDRATATGNGIALQCLYWPPEPVPLATTAADLPDVPTLLLAGDKDLSTPLEWARQEAAHAPGGKLVVVKGDGHSVQSQGGEGLAATKAFLDRH